MIDSRSVVAQFLQEKKASQAPIASLLKEAIGMTYKYAEVGELARALMLNRPGLSPRVAERVAADALDIEGG